MWYISTEEDVKDIKEFLSEKESYSVSMYAYLTMKNGKINFMRSLNNFLIFRHNMKINSLIFFKNRFMFVSIGKDSVLDSSLKRIYEKLNIDPYIIIGKKEDLDAFLKCVSIFIFKKNYFYTMTALKEEITQLPAIQEVEILQAYSGCPHMKEIAYLHKNYLEEEVYYDKQKISFEYAMDTIEKIIENFTLYYLMHENIVKAKINSNAISPNYIQIGGVYTNKDFRGHGFGSLLFNKFVNSIKNEGKNVSLFVKTNNKSAISVYKNSGLAIKKDIFAVYYTS